MQFDDLSHKSSASSLNISANTPPAFTIVNKTATQENLTQSTPTTPTPTIAKTVSPPAKPPRSEPKPQQDEWETKLFGGSKPKGILLYFELIFIVLLLLF